MASDYTAEVVRYFRRKSDDGYFEAPTYLGAEQRFVGGLRNSNVNNLEEQFLLGADTYTKSYTNANGDIVIEKSFFKDFTNVEQNKNYYKIVSTVYSSGQNYYFSDNKLILDSTTASFGDGSETYPDADSLYATDPDIYKFDRDQLNIIPSAEGTVTREDKLYYVQESGNELLVLTKTTASFYNEQGIRIVTERIHNHLAEES